VEDCSAALTLLRAREERSVLVPVLTCCTQSLIRLDMSVTHSWFIWQRPNILLSRRLCIDAATCNSMGQQI
jgi:hypothetical protein